MYLSTSTYNRRINPVRLFLTVTNQAAAIALARERKVVSPPSRTVMSQPSSQPNPAQNRRRSHGNLSECFEVSSTNSAPDNVRSRGVNASANATSVLHSRFSGGSTAAGNQVGSSSRDTQTHVSVLLDKLDWAVGELRGTQSIEYSVQLCQLIKACAEAVLSVRAVLGDQD